MAAWVSALRFLLGLGCCSRRSRDSLARDSLLPLPTVPQLEEGVSRACKIDLPGPTWRYLYLSWLGRTASGGKWHARLILFRGSGREPGLGS